MINFEVNQQAGKKISLKQWQTWIKKIQNILKLRNQLEVSVGIVGRAEIKKLNKIYRGQNKATDVLSFSEARTSAKFGLKSKNYLGEIVICYPEAARRAKQTSTNVNQTIESLFVHGFLHLLGYNHQKDKSAAAMEALEQEVLGRKL